MSPYRKWFVLVGLMLVYAASNGIVITTLPLLYPQLISDFGWTASQVSLPATVFYIVGAIASPPAGALLDRFSPRRVMIVGAILLSAALGSLSLVTTLWHLVAIYFVLGATLSLCGLTASMVVVTRWFDALRGRATGLLLMSSSLGGALFPWVLGFGTEAYGWRGGAFILSAMGAAMMLLPLALLIRDRAAPPAVENQATAGLSQVGSGPTLKQALRSPRFYLLGVATGAMWFCIVALLQHQAIHLATDLGIAGSVLPGLFSLFFACSVIGKFAFGWLGDIIDKQLTMIFSILTFAIGVVTMRAVTAESGMLLYAYAIVTGIGFAGVFTTIQLAIADQFAGPSYGKILAILVMIDSLAGAAGAGVIGALRDSAGSYQPAFLLMLGMCTLALTCMGVLYRMRVSRARPATAVA